MSRWSTWRGRCVASPNPDSFYRRHVTEIEEASRVRTVCTVGRWTEWSLLCTRRGYTVSGDPELDYRHTRKFADELPMKLSRLNDPGDRWCTEQSETNKLIGTDAVRATRWSTAMLMA